MPTLGYIDVTKKQPFWKEMADELGGTIKVKHTVSYDMEMLCLIVPYKSVLPTVKYLPLQV